VSPIHVYDEIANRDVSSVKCLSSPPSTLGRTDDDFLSFIVRLSLFSASDRVQSSLEIYSVRTYDN